MLSPNFPPQRFLPTHPSPGRCIPPQQTQCHFQNLGEGHEATEQELPAPKSPSPPRSLQRPKLLSDPPPPLSSPEALALSPSLF